MCADRMNPSSKKKQDQHLVSVCVLQAEYIPAWSSFSVLYSSESPIVEVSLMKADGTIVQEFRSKPAQTSQKSKIVGFFSLQVVLL